MADEERINQEELTEEEQAIFAYAAFGMSFSIDGFTQEIRSEIRKLRASGISDREIGRILASDLENGGRIFGSFRNSIKRGIISGIMQGHRVGQDTIYGDSLKMRWVSVGSPNICPDCQKRLGRIESWNVWESIGLPASGFSVCKESCYCQLIPTNYPIEDKVIV
tara:strand:- start:58 stop:552 length:495 start_codon:yes stop_codon:yes gene_type:complete